MVSWVSEPYYPPCMPPSVIKRESRASRRIEAAPVPWVATQDATYPAQRSAHRALALNNCNEVSATRWLESTMLAEKRANKQLIEMHSSDQHPTG